MSTSVHEQATRPDPAVVASGLRALRERGPLTHCITNIVVAGFTANVLLAAGAAPAMVENEPEAAEFAAIADGLLVNLGTLTPARAAASLAAAAAARQHGRPWVLDPVAVGGLTYRTGLAAQLLELAPTVIRGNASEVLGLAGAAGGGRGVDSTAGSNEALPAARALAARTGGVVAVSGAVDRITDGERVVEVHTGHPWMMQVTGVGCALGALVAAFAAVQPPLKAAVGATVLLTVAAERAAEVSRGPGSFAVALLDELAAVTPDQVATAVR